MQLRTWYRQLPPRKRRALFFFALGTLFFLYGILGLLGVIQTFSL